MEGSAARDLTTLSLGIQLGPRGLRLGVGSVHLASSGGISARWAKQLLVGGRYPPSDHIPSWPDFTAMYSPV
jgi:hypothetical protein